MVEKIPQKEDNVDLLTSLDRRFWKYPVPVRILIITAILFLLLVPAAYRQNGRPVDALELVAVFVLLLLSVAFAYFLVWTKKEKELNLASGAMRAWQMIFFIALSGLFYVIISWIVERISTGHGSDINWFWVGMYLVSFSVLLIGAIIGIQKGMEWAKKNDKKGEKQKESGL